MATQQNPSLVAPKKGAVPVSKKSKRRKRTLYQKLKSQRLLAAKKESLDIFRLMRNGYMEQNNTL